MKCPLLREQWRETKKEWKAEWADCIKEKCHFWNDILLECRFVSVDRRLGEIANFLGRIVEKMPHAGQFTK